MRLTTKLMGWHLGRRSGNASEDGASTSRVAACAGSRWHRACAVLGVVLVVWGAIGGVFASVWVATNDDDRSQLAFEQSSTEVASRLQLAIHDQESLVVNVSAFILNNPGGSQAAFTKWLGAVQAFKRYPELNSLGHVVMVPASELPAFASKAAAVGHSSGAGSGFTVVPAGARPFYCLVEVNGSRDHTKPPPPGLDFCAGGTAGKALLRGRDLGLSSYVPTRIAAGDTRLGVQVPIFRDGVVPATAQARRAAYLGSIGITLDPNLLLDRALQGHPGMSVSIRYSAIRDSAIRDSAIRNSADSSEVTFSRGSPSRDARSVTNDLHNGWLVQVSGVVTSGGVLANKSALALLIFRLALSILIGGLVLVLGTSRARALRLVQERTAQLRGAQEQLVDSARQAGMAEIATDVLHNVGNVLNSVNVSASLVCQKVRGTRAVGLGKAVALLHEHADDLAEFLTTDVRGRALPDYLDKLAVAQEIERKSINEELERMTAGVAHIREIVSAQQSMAGAPGVIEPVQISDLVDAALRMAGASADGQVTVVRDVCGAGMLSVDRRRLLLILVNLLTNATHALAGNIDRPRQISVRAEVTAASALSITVADNGEGISLENLTRIFVHGFTTRLHGHGFGLHGSALAAQEMGGELTVHSDGVGAGAVFTLNLPLASLTPLVRSEPRGRQVVAV